MTYSIPLVERILRNYLDIVSALDTHGTGLKDLFVVHRKPRVGELPLGQSPLDDPWPFMQHHHARRVHNGKAAARNMEDLHCAVLDVEEAMASLQDIAQHHPDETTREQAALDYWMLVHYFILHEFTIEELAKMRGAASVGSMQRRLSRSVKRLTAIMEQ